jgi:chaperonin GroEL
MNETIVKHLNFGKDAKDTIFKGIEKLTKAVSSTLGASGKCVILEDSTGNPQITKDGVTVADSIILLDPVENMGAKLLKEAARKTVKEAGDGTTTSTVLAHSILTEAYSSMDSDSHRNIKEGINKAVDSTLKYLEKISIKVTGESIYQVASISANNDKKLGRVISDAFKAVDETGVVMMETHDSSDTLVEVVDGAQYDKGFTNPHFITNNDRGIAELSNASVLLVENKIDNIRQIQGVLEYVIKKNKALLIIADVDPTVLSALAMNKIKGNIKINVIDAPVYGVNKLNTLKDLSLITGATIINEDLGDDMNMITEDHLGSCLKAVSTTGETIIQRDYFSEEVEDIIKELKKQIKETSNPKMIVQLEKRIARLAGKVAVVKVGASSEVELKEKKDRVEDAICATKAAIKEGIVPGGGIALLNAAQNIKPKTKGEEILLDAIKAPYEIILQNAGITEYEQSKDEGLGLDVVTGNTVNMVKAGIIDPLLVTKSALKNAASVATTILSTDCVINNLRANESSR